MDSIRNNYSANRPQYGILNKKNPRDMCDGQVLHNPGTSSDT